MTSPLWLLTDPSGRVIGAAAERQIVRGQWLYSDGAHRAINDAATCMIGVECAEWPYVVRAFRELVAEDQSATNYKVTTERGHYTLERQEMDG